MFAELFGQCENLVYQSENHLVDCLARVDAKCRLPWCFFYSLIGASENAFVYFLGDASYSIPVKGFSFLNPCLVHVNIWYISLRIIL